MRFVRNSDREIGDYYLADANEEEFCLSACSGCKCTPSHEGESDDRAGRDRGERAISPADLGARPTPRPTGLIPLDQHAFNAAVTETLGESIGVSDQRGIEYQDTWNVQEVFTRRLDAVLRLKGIDTSDREWKRMVLVASVCDVKTSRWQGEFKADTGIDEINYLAALTTWFREYQALESARAAMDDPAYPGRCIA